MEKLDKERYLKRVIVVCWVALAICFGIKLFGGNLFEIICENDNFIKVCEYADNHFWAKYLLYLPYSFVSLYFFVLATIQKTKLTNIQMIMVTLTTVIGAAIKLVNSYIGFLFDIWQGFIMPCIFTMKNKKLHWNVLTGNFLLIMFQLISMYVKNIPVTILTSQGVLISMIYSIDVLLMLALYFAYMNVIGERKKK